MVSISFQTFTLNIKECDANMFSSDRPSQRTKGSPGPGRACSPFRPSSPARRAAPCPAGGNGRCGKCRILAEGNLPVSEQGGAAARGGGYFARRAPSLPDHRVRDAAVTVGGEEAMGSVLSSGEMPDFEREARVVRSRRGGGYRRTTTVAAYLYDLSTCTLLRTAGAKNPQAAFRADVISRIEQSMAKHAEELSRLIVEESTGWSARWPKKRASVAQKIDQLIITGNTTMLYLLTGRPVHSLAAAPFVSDTLFGERLTGGALGLASAPDADVFLPPLHVRLCGADITCAVLASDMLSDGKPSCWWTSAPTAKWPSTTAESSSAARRQPVPPLRARASPWACRPCRAINKVYLQDGKFGFSTLSGQPAKGICGSRSSGRGRRPAAGGRARRDRSARRGGPRLSPPDL